MKGGVYSSTHEQNVMRKIGPSQFITSFLKKILSIILIRIQVIFLSF